MEKRDLKAEVKDAIDYLVSEFKQLGDDLPKDINGLVTFFVAGSLVTSDANYHTLVLIALKEYGCDEQVVVSAFKIVFPGVLEQKVNDYYAMSN